MPFFAFVFAFVFPLVFRFAKLFTYFAINHQQYEKQDFLDRGIAVKKILSFRAGLVFHNNWDNHWSTFRFLE